MSDLQRRSLSTLMRQAAQVLDERTKPSSVLPAVMWQGLAETTAAFVRRARVARASVPAEVLIIAPCAGPVSDLVVGVTWVEFPPKLYSQLHPRNRKLFRYIVAHGGRGGAKSWAYIRALLVISLEQPLRVLFFRELQTSIAESVHRLLETQIERIGLSQWFTIQQTTIFSVTGSEFIFSGVRNNVNKVRSLEGVDIAMGEEAAGVSNDSWNVLIPTIRASGSQIWAVFNPEAASDPTYQRFVVNPPETASVVEVSFRDNPWLTEELASEERYLARVDADMHAHVWLGKPMAASNAQIFRNKYSIEAFEPVAGWDGPYYGCDFGFAVDPSTLVRTWVHDRVLYIEHEAYGIGVDTDKLPAMFDVVPDARRHRIRADCARPETISWLQRHGYPQMVGVEKWHGSVEDGIAHMRSYERIVVHPRCTHAAEEFRLYSYRVDRLSGDILPEPLDKFNHMMDAIRYALVPLIRRSGMGFYDYMRMEAEALAARQGNTAQPTVTSCEDFYPTVRTMHERR